MLEAGTVLEGKYRIERVLGKGGMATVYLAHHLVFDEPVAVKEMMVGVDDDEQRALYVQQFNREAELLSRVQHPSLINIMDFFQYGEGQYIVMTYVPGRTLDQVFQSMQELPTPREVLRWVDQICDVLAYIHQLDPPLIYRDLKPSNIMLDDTGRIWLLDFGIAREADLNSRTSTLLKGVGTPGYSPPEQFGLSITDVRSDIYALGATMYALLTGQRPPVSVDLMMGEARLELPSGLNPEIPPALDRVIVRMMAPHKDQRFQTIEEAREVLRSIPLGSTTGGAGASRSGGDTQIPFAAPRERLRRVPAPILEATDSGRLPTSPTLPPAARPFPGLPGPIALPPRGSDIEAPVHLQMKTEPSPVSDALWQWALTSFCLCLLIGVPSLINPHIGGILFLPTALLYPFGRAFNAFLDAPLSALGGTLVQFGVPLLFSAWFFYRRMPFWAYVCLYVATQGILTVGVDLANGASSGLAKDWSLLLGLEKTDQAIKSGHDIRALGLLAMLGPLYFMAGWLWKGCPYLPLKVRR